MSDERMTQGDVRLREELARIIAFTFTNKAAEEIATRLDEVPDAALVRRTTIHKFCVDVLREHGPRINVDPGFGIADEEYQCALLGQLGSSARNHKGLLQMFARHRLLGPPQLLLDTGDFRRVLLSEPRDLGISPLAIAHRMAAGDIGRSGAATA